MAPRAFMVKQEGALATAGGVACPTGGDGLGLGRDSRPLPALAAFLGPVRVDDRAAGRAGERQQLALGGKGRASGLVFGLGVRRVLQGIGGAALIGAAGWGCKSFRLRRARKLIRKVNLKLCSSSSDQVGTRTKDVIKQVLPQECQLPRSAAACSTLNPAQWREVAQFQDEMAAPKARQLRRERGARPDPRQYGTEPHRIERSKLDRARYRSTGSPPDDALRVPAMRETLRGIFKPLQKDACDRLGKKSIYDLIQKLNHHFQVGFLASDADRLFAFLGGTKAKGIDYEQFLTDMEKLLHVLEHLQKQMTLAQLKVVVCAAFDRFDTNNDGEISAQELAVAANVMGLQIDDRHIQLLHRFFVPSSNFKIAQECFADDRSVLEKWQSALQGFVDKTAERMGIDCADRLAKQVLGEIQKPGDLAARLRRAGGVVSDGAEQLADAASTAVNASGMALAVQYVSQSLASASHDLSQVDWQDLAPLLLFLGTSTVTLAKELDELVPKEMSEDEALLYARVFHQHGFSQADFRRLLSCEGCEWSIARQGEVLINSLDDSVKIVVKGRVGVSVPGAARSAMLLPGATLNEGLYLRDRKLVEEGITVKAVEEVTYIKWRIEPLRTMFIHHEKMAVRFDEMLAESMARNVTLLSDMLPSSSLAGRDMKELFDHFDADSSGTIDRLELRAAVREMGLKRSPQELQEIVSQMCRDGTGVVDAITYGEFVEMMRVTTAASVATVSEPSQRKKPAELGEDIYEEEPSEGPKVSGAVRREPSSPNSEKHKMDLHLLLSSFDKKWLLCMSEQDRKRLADYVGCGSDGMVDTDKLHSKIRDLTGCLEVLGVGSLPMVVNVLRDSFARMDNNSDGVIEKKEFLAHVLAEHPEMTRGQAEALHEYLDNNNDGAVDLPEWDQGADIFSWVSAASSAINSHSQKLGLNRIQFLLGRVQDVLCKEMPLQEKVQLIQKMGWDSFEALADVADNAVDLLGVCAALFHVSKIVNGLDADDDGFSWEQDGLNLAPLVIFFGLSATQISQYFKKEEVATELGSSEAALYLQAFEPRGFTIAEFRRVIRAGEIKWHSVEPGRALDPDADKLPLRIIVDGLCEVSNERVGAPLTLGPGEFLGVAPTLGMDGSLWGEATVTVRLTLVSFENKRMWEFLDSNLRAKMHRALNLSMADHLHSAYVSRAKYASEQCLPLLPLARLDKSAFTSSSSTAVQGVNPPSLQGSSFCSNDTDDSDTDGGRVSELLDSAQSVGRRNSCPPVLN